MYLLAILTIAIIFSVQPTLKKKIMKEYTVDEFTLCLSVITVIFSCLLPLFNKNKSNFKFNFKNKSKLSYGLLVIIGFTTIVYSQLLNNLLLNYDVSKIIPNIRCLEMIFIFLIAIFLNKEVFSYKKLLGIILVTLGIYISK